MFECYEGSMNERLKKGFYPLVLCKNICSTTDTHLFYFSMLFLPSSTHVTISCSFWRGGKITFAWSKIYLYCYCFIGFPYCYTFLCLSSDKIVVYYNWNFFISISSALFTCKLLSVCDWITEESSYTFRV